jgi:hypothetical protein
MVQIASDARKGFEMLEAMLEFDKWAKSRELDTTKHPSPKDGWIYSDIETQMFWECWLASRMALIGFTG